MAARARGRATVVEDDTVDEPEFIVVNPDNPRRILFSGNEKSARAYLESNFPRPGGDNGEHQAHLVHPNGNTQTFIYEDGWADPEGDAPVTEVVE